jgi:hypothetical protein
MLGPNAYKTFQATSPKRTHWRKAKSCEEFDCANYLNGWKMVIYPDTDQGKQHLAVFEPHKRQFRYTAEKRPDGGIEYTFSPGQDCFELPNHQIRLPYPERFFVRNGDVRQFGRTIELNPEDFQGEMNLNNEAFNRRLEG